MKYFVYIIRSSSDSSYYTGLTNNLERRLREHNVGKISTRTTYKKGPYRLIHAEEVESLGEARTREKYWKSGYGRELRMKLDITNGV